jgi:hypothetical protein
VSVTEVVDRFGTVALLRLLLLVTVFVVLHLARLPLVWVARALEVCMSRVDRAVVAGVSGPRPHRPNRPHPDPRR